MGVRLGFDVKSLVGVFGDSVSEYVERTPRGVLQLIARGEEVDLSPIGGIYPVIRCRVHDQVMHVYQPTVGFTWPQFVK